jgi:hypothetical protein
MRALLDDSAPFDDRHDVGVGCALKAMGDSDDRSALEYPREAALEVPGGPWV